MTSSQKIDNAEPMDIATMYFPKMYFNVIILYLHEGFSFFIYTFICWCVVVKSCEKAFRTGGCTVWTPRHCVD